MTENTAELLHHRLFERSPVLREIADRVERGGVISVGRAEGSAGSLMLAYLARDYGTSLVVVTPSADEADRTRRDLSLFLDDEVLEFPTWESLFEEDSEPDAEIYSQRYGVVDAAAGDRRIAVVAPMQALLQPIGRTQERSDRRVILRVGDTFPPGDLARALVDAGYRRFPQVARPGDFSIRGGIFDIYPREGKHPYRVDFFGDEVDSIRTFSIEDQRSRDDVNLLVLSLMKRSDYFIRGFTGKEQVLFDRLPEDVVIAVVDPRRAQERCESLIGQWAGPRAREIASEFWGRAARNTRVELHPLTPEKGRNPVTLPVTGVEAFTGTLDRVVETIQAESTAQRPVCAYFRLVAEAERFREILDERGVPGICQVVAGDLSGGFRWNEDHGGIFLAGSILLGRTTSLDRRAKKTVATRAVDNFVELSEGDLVVHVGHGIGKFVGVRHVTQGRRTGDHLVLQYRDGVNLLVPAERIDLVQKYVGVGKANPKLDRLGSKNWAKRREKVEEDLRDLAAEMIEMQALRAEREGTSFPPDNHYVEEFEAAFPFQETADQLTAIEAIRKDLESTKPMDRLVCGDVGYGKTELAMRAAFKVVQGGKQVAVVVPTTVLAQQHYVTFRDRMAEFPVRIATLSRFNSRKEQTEVLRQAREGEVDIVIGTHRLFSSDVSFEDIGLIVIDEEQRFGVVHKEKLKQLRRMVDVLTLTATPIPRTLHMALVGVKDISSLNEAPQGRSPIQTEVCAFEEPRFRQIFLRELNRDGQIFFLHNRVHSIESRMHDLQRLIPEAKMIFVHGQMDENELEKRMLGFINKEFNVLVCTTIIESGLDIPSANTIVIERADRFGLAELHQLRGRVGRGHHKAFAYFLLPEGKPVGGDALARLRAIEEFSQLGSGFQIAMRDLEIRGAGNILGKEQSGHIAVVGYDLFCRLLQRAVDQLQGTVSHEPPDVELAIDGHSRIPETYIPDETHRLRIYRAIATSLEVSGVREIQAGMVDQYGPVPAETTELLRQQELRVIFGQLGATKVSIEDGWLLLEGDSRPMTDALRGASWEVVHPPGPAIAARARGESISSLEDVHRAVQSTLAVR
ncbi:MAG: transcription-repair coupling factor [Planctomycetota bacterium]